jgi:hypothetical protein
VPRDQPRTESDQRRVLATVVFAFGILFAYVRAERGGMYAIPGFSFGLAPFAITEAGEPATATGAAVMSTLETMESHIVSTRFRHETEVDEARGIYDFDSSGLCSWILQRSAPLAFESIGSLRPVAEDFARTIHAAPTSDDQGGWRRLTQPSELRPGDLIAWTTPQSHREDGLTGHVAIVVGMPAHVPGLDEAWSVRIADATNEFHQWDSRFMSFDLDGGVGRGTITLAVAEDGHPYAYGWQGPWSPMFHRNDVELGRVTR